jgi:uncharacterized membrane protein (DUF485 family)
VSRTTKKTTPNPTYKRLAGLTALLSAFLLGLLAAWLQPGAVLALMIGFGLVVLALLVESFYLWQVARMQEFNRKNRARRTTQKKEEVAQ